MATATLTRPEAAANLTPAQLKKKANTKVRELAYPSDNLTGAAWREAYDAYLIEEEKGFNCQNCGSPCGKGYDGMSDRTVKHFTNGLGDGSVYCYPELREYR